MSNAVRYSIIIPVKELNDYIRETVPHILRLDRRDWELIIVTNDEQLSEWPSEPRIHIIHSGRVGPAEKRDLAAKVALGEVLVFLDDDSYPQSDHLDVADTYFLEGATAVGGPAITPASDSYLQKVSGAVFSSRLTGGSPERYRPVGLARDVDDWPSVNLMVRKDVFDSIGGFDSPYWPGEDTFLCLKLLREGHHVKYVPNLIVWHHRREGLLRHVRQVGAYGLHRGYFARHLPETSRRPQYFLPTLVLLMLVSYPVTFLLPSWVSFIGTMGILTYASGVFLGMVDLTRHEGLRIAIGSFVYIVATHISYGWNFLRGFFRRAQLISRLR